MTGATLDSGALPAVPAGVLAQAWRGGRQARLARLLRAPSAEVVALDELTGRAIGVLCGRSGATDVVDVSVVVCARERGHRVVSSDREHLLAIDPTLRVAEP